MSSPKPSVPVKRSSTPSRPSHASPLTRSGSRPATRRRPDAVTAEVEQRPPSLERAHVVLRTLDRRTTSESPAMRRAGRSESTSGLREWPRSPHTTSLVSAPHADLPGARERLPHEHMLPAASAHRPLEVERVRQRDVDRVELVVRQQRVVGAVGARDTVRRCVGLGTRRVARRHGIDPERRIGRAGAQNRLVDLRRREEPEPNGQGSTPSSSSELRSSSASR